MPSFKRDMDYVRTLLLAMEGGKHAFNTLSPEIADCLGIDRDKAIPREDAQRLEYHLKLLQDAEFVELDEDNGGQWLVRGISWKGHEFLETVRDPEVWRRTREGMTKAGNSGVAFAWELAKGYAKQALGEHLHIALG
jgi:hypothetical protein